MPPDTNFRDVKYTRSPGHLMSSNPVQYKISGTESLPSKEKKSALVDNFNDIALHNFTSPNIPSLYPGASLFSRIEKKKNTFV